MSGSQEDNSSLLLNSLALLGDLGRLHAIAQVLVRYGFADIVQRIGMASILAGAGKTLNWQETADIATMSTPERARHALQALGPTFVKLGQILATRADLFTPEWIAQFEMLQDQVRALDFAQLRPQLETDLGAAPEEVFAFIDTTALAAASIGQVHRARLADGSEVVLKIRRPDIRPRIEADLRLLARLASIAEQEIGWLAHFKPVELARQFSESLRQELDLAVECRNAQRVAENFAGHPPVRVPKVYWEWTSERLNVQEFVAGIPARDLCALIAERLDPRLVASRITHACLAMTLEHGFFHADPHAGKLFVLPENEIVLIDWGMVGRVSETRRRQVLKLLLGLIERDARSTTLILLEWAGDKQVHHGELLNEVESFIDRYHGVPLKELNLLALLGDVTRILRKHQLALPPDMALMIKAISTLEGLGRLLNPDYQIVEEAEPALRRLMLGQYGPQALMQRGWDVLREGIDLLADLPRELRGLTQAARRGQLRVGVDMAEIGHLGNEFSRAANRLAIALITSACILGASLIAALAERAGSGGIAGLGLYMLAGAGLGGLWLLISIWRSGGR